MCDRLKIKFLKKERGMILTNFLKFLSFSKFEQIFFCISNLVVGRASMTGKVK